MRVSEGSQLLLLGRAYGLSLQMGMTRFSF